MRQPDFDYCVLLKRRAEQVQMLPMFEYMLSKYPHFKDWSGSHAPMFHHYERNGLARHTAEIVELGFSTITTLHLENQVDPKEFFLAGLYHDAGKMFDYRPVTTDFSQWTSTEHRRLIHHLPRSVIIFHDAAVENSLPKSLEDNVIHAILAHHGCREAGSPVAPKSRVAWLLHLCDGLSARMDDCERFDIVKPPLLSNPSSRK